MLTFYLTIIGFVFVGGFAVISVYNNNIQTANILFVSLVFAALNLILLNTRFKNITRIILAMICGVISLHLLTFGGLDETGFLWTYPLLTLGIAVLSFREGLVFSGVIVCATASLLYLSNDTLWIVDYPPLISTRYLVSFIALCAISLVLVRIQERTNRLLNTKNITDELTGLFNRGVIKQKLNPEELQIQDKDNYLMLLDVDHFKSINDNFGHDYGDQILKILADIIHTNKRADDIAIRWGGEEFLLVLRNCTKTIALTKAEELRHGLETDNRILELLQRPVTMSIGVSKAESQMPIEESLKITDKNLYTAKNSGRNQVVYS